MRQRSRRARRSLLYGLGLFVALQVGASLLLLGPLSWLRSPCYARRLTALAARTGEYPLTVVAVGSSRTVFAETIGTSAQGMESPYHA